MLKTMQADDLESHVTTPAAPCSNMPGLVGRRVLVAENEAIIALDLQAILHGFGCTVLKPATSAAEALALLQRERPDMALINPILNDGSAMPLVETLCTAGVPFALVSNRESNKRGAAALPNAPRLDWPYGSKELRQTLLQLLQGQKQSPEFIAAGG